MTQHLHNIELYVIISKFVRSDLHAVLRHILLVAAVDLVEQLHDGYRLLVDDLVDHHLREVELLLVPENLSATLNIFDPIRDKTPMMCTTRS